MSKQADSFFFNAKASYQDQVHLYLDVSTKDDTVRAFFFDGPKVGTYREELEELSLLVLNKKITDLKLLSRSLLKHEHQNAHFQKCVSSLSLTLLKEAILQYLGENKTFPEQHDFICLCFGVTKKEIVSAVIANKDYDLKTLVQTTRATSACGSCKGQIEQLIQGTREKHGLLKGTDNSRSRTNLQGEWIKVLGLYPGPLLWLLEEHKQSWMAQEEIVGKYVVEFKNIAGLHLDVVVQGPQRASLDKKQSEGLLLALAEYLKSKTGVLFFLHAL